MKSLMKKMALMAIVVLAAVWAPGVAHAACSNGQMPIEKPSPNNDGSNYSVCQDGSGFCFANVWRETDGCGSAVCSRLTCTGSLSPWSNMYCFEEDVNGKDMLCM